MNRKISTMILSSCLAAALDQPLPARAGDIVGHVIAGYQGWFANPGDGSPVGKLGTRGNDHHNLETYPDLREFPDSELFPTSWGNLPNGTPSKMFSSDRAFTIERHVEWMKQYGVDVAAVQRFGEVANDVDYRQQKNEVTTRMMKSCQANGVKFYIEYDASGSGGGGWGPDFVSGIQRDWTEFGVRQKIAASPAYARENGKPVVELWGIGGSFNNISADPVKWLTLINWFKAQGCYVIAGVPTGWKITGSFSDALTGFDNVYAACNGINPWIVGRLRSDDDCDRYASRNLGPELAWCKQKGIDYIPCVYPGTSFYNSNQNSAKNICPRRSGDLMWRQFANIRSKGVTTCFVSMFDEYNEATAIAKTAEDVSQMPAGKWYLPLTADGASMSSDYYLRLTSDGGKMMKGQSALQWTKPTPYWNDLLNTGFEPGQPQPTWMNTPDTAYNNSAKNVSGYAADIGVECSLRTGKQFQSGSTSLMYSGTANGGAATYCYYKVLDFSAKPLTIGSNTLLHYWIYPQNENGRFAGIDMLFTDGTTLGKSKCVDQNGIALRASAGHGGSIPLNAWSVVTGQLGSLAGKKVSKIWVVFDRAGATGQYRGYIDDVRLTN